MHALRSVAQLYCKENVFSNKRAREPVVVYWILTFMVAPVLFVENTTSYFIPTCSSLSSAYYSLVASLTALSSPHFKLFCCLTRSPIIVCSSFCLYTALYSPLVLLPVTFSIISFIKLGKPLNKSTKFSKTSRSALWKSIEFDLWYWNQAPPIM